MSIPDETLARWAAWPRPGTRGLWCAHIDGDGSPGEVVCHDPDQPIFTAQVAQFVEPEDIAAIAALPEMREAIDVLVAEVRDLEAKVARVQAVLDDAWTRLSPDAEEAIKEAIS